MKKVKALLSLLAFAGIVYTISSCSKTGATGATGSAGAQGVPGAPGPVLTGTINGYVLLNDEYGNPVTSGLSSAWVLLFNSADNSKVDSVNADSTGKFTMSNIKTGNYTMIAMSIGYGSAYHQNLEFNGGTLTVDNKLSAIPNFNVTNASDSIRHKTNQVYIYGNIPLDSRQRTLLIFVGNTASTSASPSTYVFAATQAVPADSSRYTITIPLGTIYGNGFASGNTAYFAIYGAANNYTNGDYTDFASGRLVYTPITPTPYIPLPSIVLP